jgi:2-(1,2-epoxy-1,2-dihydrophenyl)acetyl-CoA isomerase
MNIALACDAEPVPAEEALRMGLVSKVFDDASFRADVAAYAAQLAQGPALAYRLIKEAVRESLSNTLDEQLAVEAGLQAQAGFSHDFAEGVRAFREKRAPRFEGR